MQESHFFGLFLVHQEVDGLALIAEFTLRVSDLRTALVLSWEQPCGTSREVRWDYQDCNRNSYTLRGCAKGLLSSSFYLSFR